ncbi:hypothetical protein [Aestuariicoccus sp. MJ-SS9]|uniref:hypothetical protein n=1 Tax=Aestuariicoccus sp. MJ-SS9 TaxID=3079855 RepID=UPI00290B9AA6|nr:hypothetical protein [Aestuariicoccus sp. MJ-SS9]MDU8911137.1 hypothetical protein [Aestuariicoccus sp. MJ-SS9]
MTGTATDWVALISSGAGVLGSLALAYPIWKGLPDRRGYEAALKNHKDGLIDETGFAAARGTYLTELLGSYGTNRTWTWIGLGMLFAAFLLPLGREAWRLL